MGLDPIKTTEVIRNSYLRYLETSFPIQDSEISKQFRQQLHEPDRLVKGPILEATPPYRLGKSIGGLIGEGILSQGFKNLCGEYLPLERPLYEHQEKAIHKLVTEKRNIVVATGTGSGKTEVLLIPIFNHLLREREKGSLGSGVRALLLYPMNALANDQMKRLRRVLKSFPYITFGRYTGETKETKRYGEDHFHKNFPDEDRIENELLSREEMRDNPPHILLTNYAMLEYLLLRPEDCEFFDGDKAKYWRFLVVDEAHTYDGAKGIEAAMLIRRLKDRIVESEPEKLQCIATSATLGRGREDFPRVVEFAFRLFGEQFEWIEKDPEKQDVVEASRIPTSEMGDVWGNPDPSLYEAWTEALADLSSSLIHKLVEIGIEKGIPEKVLKNAEDKARQSKSVEESIERFLFHVLNGDARLQSLRKFLEKEPDFLTEVSKSIFPSLTDNEAQQKLKSLVDLAVQAKPDRESQSLLPARYHLFVRALEGAYVSLAPKKQFFLDRRETNKVNGHEYPVFEMATCRRCGHIYLVGQTRTENGKLVQTKEISEENREKAEFYLLSEQGAHKSLPENEDELTEDDDETKEELYVLCACCGAIEQEGLLTALCSCEVGKEHQQSLQKVPSKDRVVNHCPACGARSPNLVGRFLTGQDAPASVLATALYQQIPPKMARDNEDLEPSNIGRQLLIFSDSRQDAAFFACYLDRTYAQILRRRLIIRALEENKDKARTNSWRIQDLVQPIRRQAEQLQIFSQQESLQEKENKVWKWLLLELLAYDRRNSLEGLGLLGFTLLKPENWQAPKPLLQKPWELAEEEVLTLYQILLDSIRIRGAIAFPDNVSPEDDDFRPRNQECYFRENGSAPKKHIFSWASPGKNRLNRRLDFLSKLSKRLSGTDASIEACKRVLTDIWKESLFPLKSTSCWRDYFLSSSVQGEGKPYRLRYGFWELRSRIIDSAVRWYQCDTCGNLSLHNLRGICPTYRCQGNLNVCNPDEVFKDNHYRRLYLEFQPMRLLAKEHTAQLTSEAAANLQDSFVKGETNVLSCSTTFELGVDVGELEAVLMRNVPPSAANYIQRAGRAGRRTDSTAFALTFAQRRSHDLTHFREPKRMVSGKIRSPYFEICNEKIVRRHIHAVALAAFWRENRLLFSTVDSFFFPPQKSGPEVLKEFLKKRPDFLKEALLRIVPESLQVSLGVNDWSWLSELFDEGKGVLKKAADEIRGDVGDFEDIWKGLNEQRKKSDHILRLITTLKSRSAIDFLSSRNVLPKYGFPVDVVELQVLHHGEEAKELELNRDLRIALSEYAPRSEVVAGGKVWVSYGLKRLPKRDWLKYEYAVCQKCQLYQRVLAGTGRPLQNCNLCSFPLEGHRVKGTFIVPEFGFVTSNEEPKRPREAKPERTYTTHVYFSGDSSPEGNPCELELDGVKFIATAAREGRMAVLNRAGFRICSGCGFGIRINEKKIPNAHKTPFGRECTGTFSGIIDLGHEFITDILALKIEGYSNTNQAFWLSFLYALLEGASESLEVSRDDLNGCLYPYDAGDPTKPAIILFDDVPGGAGHVKRLAKSPDMLKHLLEATRNRVNCSDCGEETSCYGCLHNYRNQFWHDKLKRGMVKEFLEKLL